MGAGRRTTIHVSGQGAALQPGPVGGGRAGVGEDSSRLEASLSLRAKVPLPASGHTRCPHWWAPRVPHAQGGHSCGIHL